MRHAPMSPSGIRMPQLHRLNGRTASPVRYAFKMRPANDAAAPNLKHFLRK
ncbi:hypothetical protein Bphyt_3066 [Paraburkholderia phytofirmans PsJN]|uniref:Uncharacterized protein n=1 Tax=Paraburkholderia phytofirmans (strain DSM 17436 / LMG 22146 / PsJN) TaxID=398527 RepID=B2T694_PARPJ|nr:hypothetical protein Bphyt_3066 [Paraburkholderia phytofirmans PsJN]